MKNYKAIKGSNSLENIDHAKNHNKVYHVAVLERHDGQFDVICQYGRRGKGLQANMKGASLSLAEACHIFNKVVYDKTGSGYVHAEQKYSMIQVWGHLVPSLANSTPTPNVSEPSAPKQDPKERKSNEMVSLIIDDPSDSAPDTWFW